MKAYSISYDLNKSGKNYEGLIKAIKAVGASCHCTDSYWLVSTDQSAEDVYKKLKPHLDDDDHIFITRIMGDRQGWLPKDKWEWIDKHVPSYVAA